MPIREAMKPTTKRTSGKLLNLPDALEANVRAGDLWSLFHSLNERAKPAWPAAPVRSSGLRIVRSK